MTGRLDAPASLLGEPDRFLTEAECRSVAARVMDFARGGGETAVIVDSGWRGFLRWGRNEATLAGDQRTHAIHITRTIRGTSMTVRTNQLDDVSLEAAVRAAERRLEMLPVSPVVPHRADPLPRFEYLAPATWSDATYDLGPDDHGAAARAAIEGALGAKMLSAGYLEVRGGALSHIDSRGPSLYSASTDAQCSLTVRNPSGTGSGWAGLSGHDWAGIDPSALAGRALEKCLASQNPVALEPGRYTVILEPQAVCELVSIVVARLDRDDAERGRGPFASDRSGYSKLGMPVADERVTIGQDPMHPHLGVTPFVLATGEPVPAVNWIERGVLTSLAYDRRYALTRLNENLGRPNAFAYRMSGGATSIDEMIRTTRRGLLVTRFSNVETLDPHSLLSTGLTRDGLWLVENGKISKAVKNFRFTESPLFVLNSIEQLGAPVPVFRPRYPAVVPPLKARDFSFTSTIDAI